VHARSADSCMTQCHTLCTECSSEYHSKEQHCVCQRRPWLPYTRDGQREYRISPAFHNEPDDRQGIEEQGRGSRGRDGEACPKNFVLRMGSGDGSNCQCAPGYHQAVASVDCLLCEADSYCRGGLRSLLVTSPLNCISNTASSSWGSDSGVLAANRHAPPTRTAQQAALTSRIVRVKRASSGTLAVLVPTALLGASAPEEQC